jgi:hypothetical protein
VQNLNHPAGDGNKLLSAALSLAKRRIHVFPCAPRGKIPITAHGCLDASKDLDQIQSWWSAHPDANIGVATGSKSGIWVLDIDGEDGEGSIRDLEKRIQPLPTTIESITGGGGRHLFFRLPDFKDAPTIRNSAKQLGIGLDVRGEGGYVVAPSSVHPSGRPYAWSVDTATEFAHPPVWLIALITLPQTGVTHLDERRSPDNWKRVAEGVPEGSRNMNTASLTGYLLRRNVRPDITLELMLGWNLRNQPPLPEDGIVRTVESIVTRELKRRGLQQ